MAFGTLLRFAKARLLEWRMPSASVTRVSPGSRRNASSQHGSGSAPSVELLDTLPGEIKFLDRLEILGWRRNRHRFGPVAAGDAKANTQSLPCRPPQARRAGRVPHARRN